MGWQIFKIEGKLSTELTPQGDLTRDIETLYTYLNEEIQTDDNFLDATDFPNSYAYSNGTTWVSQTVAEMKTALGLPTNIMVGKVSSTNIDGVGIITSTITKNINSFSVAETAEFSWAKSGTGYYRFTIPSAYDCLDGKTIINAFAVTIPSGFEIIFTYSNTYMQVNLYKNGVLTDLETDTSFTITFEFKVYE